MIRILIVDDQKLIREMLKATLSTEPDFEIVGTADDGEKAVEQVKQLDPDLVLLDLVMPNMDGLTTTKIIRQNSIATKIIILSVCEDQEYLTNSIQAGASGYLSKTTSASQLKETIRTVHRGYTQSGTGLLEKIRQKQAHFGFKAPFLTKNKATSILTAEPVESIRSDSAGVGDRANSKSNSSQPLQPQNWPRLIILSAVATAVIGGSYWGSQLGKKPIPSAALNQVTSTNVASTNVELTGKVKPDKIVKTFAESKSLVEDIYVEIGEGVDKNQPLLLLDNLEDDTAIQQQQQQQQKLEKQKQAAIAELQIKQAQIQELEVKIEDLKQTPTPLIAQIAQAKTATAIAQNNLDKIATAQNGDSPEISQTIYQQAQSKLDRYQQLYGQGAIPQETLEQAQVEVKIAQANYQNATAAATAKQELLAAIAKQKQLEQQLDSLQIEQRLITAESQLETAQQEYEQSAEQLELLEEKADEINKQLELLTYITFKASTDGVIVALPTQIGEQIKEGEVLVGLAQLETLKIEVPVQSSLVERLRLGQKATITTAVGNNTLEFVGEIVTLYPDAAQTENYIVELKFSNPNGYSLVDQVATVQFKI